MERINDRVSQAVMETCLAMTIFRDEFNAEFVAMFTILTFVKVFHWLIQDRVDYIETTPSISRLQHFRVVSFMLTLLVSNIFRFHVCGHALLQSFGKSSSLHQKCVWDLARAFKAGL